MGREKNMKKCKEKKYSWFNIRLNRHIKSNPVISSD